MIHQGTQIVPADLLAGLQTLNPLPQDHHTILLSNFFAQSEALMKGKTEVFLLFCGFFFFLIKINYYLKEEAKKELQETGMNEKDIEKLAPHKTFVGNKPTNSIIYSKLCPSVLGSLIALYEHKVFVQGNITL